MIPDRRQFTASLVGAALAGALLPARAQTAVRQPYLADMHSHYGMWLPRLFGFDLDRHMRENGVTLLAWAIVDDGAWTGTGAGGRLQQLSEPAPGAIWANWQRLVTRYQGRLDEWKVRKALTVADVDASLAGQPHVLLACESANFLEGRIERLAQAHALGVRHLQLVHFIRSPLGDFQTAAPTHGGLTAVGAQVVAECRRLGIAVDLAHGTASLVDAALAASGAPMVWSHSWISPQGGAPADAAYVARSLSEATARRIAAQGGVIGLWCMRRGNDPAYPVSSKGRYADEILRMCDLVGPRHVAFGTDMEGVGASRVMSDYGDLRDVVDDLLKRGIDEKTLHGVFVGNYARVVRAAMAGAQ